MPKDNVAARLVLEFHFFGVLAIVAYWYDTQKELPSEELKGLLHGICFEGILQQFSKYK